MGPTRLSVLILSAVIVALSVPPASSQTETVELQLKLGRGEMVFQASTGSLQLALDLGPFHQENSHQVQARHAVRVLDVDATGTMLVESVLEDFQLTSGGRTEEHISSPDLFRVQPDGKVVERQIGAQHVEDFPVALPGRPVVAGDSWTRQTTFEEAGVTATGTETVTLSRIEHVEGGRIAHLQVRGDGTVTATELTRTLPPGIQARASGTVRTNAEVAYSVEQGRLLSSAGDLSINIQMEVTGEGQTIAGTLKITATVQERLLAPVDVTVPAISPDLLIVPGKGVGKVSLDLLVAEVTDRFGPPTSGSTFSHRTTMLTWPNHLQGHVEVSDQTKLVGLEISNRAYRTEKGIGHSSSQGAVLMAYGMTPTRLEMTDPAVGGVRMLIYDDQGIAFAIISDQAHADRGLTQTPVATVDWITVYPTGGAAKIYPLP